MSIRVVSKFLCHKSPIFFLNSLNNNKFLIFLVSNFFIFYLIFFFKYSYMNKSSNLIDMGSYEIPVIETKNNFLFKTVVWYILKFLTDDLLFIFSIVKDYSLKSIEIIFRNAKWLEREITDFFNISFINKRDRRSLFSIPFLYESPFKKKFPCMGFYELFICFFTKKIIFKHISVKS